MEWLWAWLLELWVDLGLIIRPGNLMTVLDGQGLNQTDLAHEHL